jgi:MFS family permease
MDQTGGGYRRRWAVLALVLAAECMDLLDGSVVNVAAPTIRTELRASAAALQWIIGGYALAIGLITGARLGDRYGRKRLFVAGSAGFAVASLAAATAVSPAMLIGCRLAQGAAAALLIPQGLGIIRDVFAPAEQGRGLATSSAELIPAQLILGAGIGMLISPLFDFILAAVSDHQVGSASGVLNTIQQLAGAIGVAVIGTVFFGTLARSGFAAAISRCLTIELGVAAVLFVLARALPRRPREEQAAQTGPADPAVRTAPDPVSTVTEPGADLARVADSLTAGCLQPEAAAVHGQAAIRHVQQPGRSAA